MIAHEERRRPVGRGAPDIFALPNDDETAPSISRMGSVSLFPTTISPRFLKPFQKIISRQRLRKVCPPLPLVFIQMSLKSQPRIQYSWLPDVFRVKDSVTLLFSHVYMPHSFNLGHPAFFGSYHNRYTLGSVCLLLVVGGHDHHHDKFRRPPTCGCCKFPCRILSMATSSFPIEVGLILVFRQV